MKVPTANFDQRQLAPRKSIKLGIRSDLDLSDLTDEQAQVLQQKHAQEVISINAEAQRIVLGTQELQKKLEVMNDAASYATREGVSMKMHDRTTGPSGVTTTEIVTRSSREVAIIYALIAVVVVVVIVLAIVAMHK